MSPSSSYLESMGVSNSVNMFLVVFILLLVTRSAMHLPALYRPFKGPSDGGLCTEVQ